MHKIILGHVEDVALPSLGIDSVIAKVDTGAFSGALHSTGIKLSEDGSALSFNPMGREDLRVTVDDFQMRVVRSASGHSAKRFLVPVGVKINGRVYPTMIGLADRSHMGRGMLLGRRFLKEHKMLVDVTINDEHDEEWRRLHR